MADTTTCATCGRENRAIAQYCRFCGGLMPEQGEASAGASAAAASEGVSAGASAAAASEGVSAGTSAAAAASEGVSAGTSAAAAASGVSAPGTSTETAVPRPPETARAAIPVPPIPIPLDYVGHTAIREELDRIKRSIKFQKERRKAGAGGPLGSKLFIFRGETGTGKTLIASSFVKELQREKCLESDRVTIIEARKLSRQYADEYALAGFLAETKPAALVVDDATENTGFIHELILAVSKAKEECYCVIVGSKEGMESFFNANAEDRQRIAQFFEFSELSNEELAMILMQQLREKNYLFSPDLRKHMEDYIKERTGDSACEYRNGWLIEKDIIPTIEKNQERRLTSTLDASSLTPDDYRTIKQEDLPLKYKRKTVEEILAELDSMIGLAGVKRSVRELANAIKMGQEREEKGLKGQGQAIHIVFTGNPGTGKTTVARKLGALFKTMGLLPTDKLVETDRSGLVAGYVGQTAPQVNAVCDKAMGGILFIDEAYTLSTEGGDGFGQEAIDTLLKRMEDDRGKFVVIAAGYEKEMERFIQANPGLKSRFTHFLSLADYESEELYEIFCSMAKGNGYALSAEAEEAAKSAIEEIHRNKGRDFANGRTVRNLLDDTIRRMSSRLAAMSSEARTAEALSTITREDIPGTKEVSSDLSK